MVTDNEKLSLIFLLHASSTCQLSFFLIFLLPISLRSLSPIFFVHPCPLPSSAAVYRLDRLNIYFFYIMSFSFFFSYQGLFQTHPVAHQQLLSYAAHRSLLSSATHRLSLSSISLYRCCHSLYSATDHRQPRYFFFSLCINFLVLLL